MEHKKIRLILSCIALLLELLLLSNLLRTQYRNNKFKDQIKANAVAFIQKKYGFTAEPIEIEQEHYSSDSDRWKEQNSVVTMQKDNKKFHVFTSIDPESDENADDYQYDEINEALKQQFEAAYPGGTCILVQTYDPNLFGIHALGCIKPYYDGSNLAQICENRSCNVRMICVQPETDAQLLIDAIDGLSISGYVIAFSDADVCNTFAQAEDTSYIEEYLPYINDYVKINGNQIQPTDYVINQHDDFLYCYSPNPYNRENGDSSKDIMIQEPNQNMIAENAKKFWHAEAYAEKQIGKVYKVQSFYGDVFLYYPLSAEIFKEHDPENTGAFWFSQSGIANDHDIALPEIIGEYAVYRLPYSDQWFMMTDLTGMPKYIPDWKKDKTS